MVTGRPGRRGLLWTLLVLLALGLSVDLLRGPSSLLRGWWSGLAVTRGESTRGAIEQVRRRAWGR